ncbi:MAG: dihydrofolate reductase family protein, partial [Planctomycetota bacterium]|nr:dihydrofolate reductase family protein [Planctomycetota bacterium]
GGGELAAGLLAEGLVDEVLAFVAPKLLGGRMAPCPVGGRGIELVDKAKPLVIREFRPVGGDLFIRAGPVTPAWRCEP